MQLLKNAKRTFFILCLCIPFILLGCGEEGSSDAGTSGSGTVTIASNNTSTSWYMYTGALANLLRDAEPVSVTADVLSYAGGVGNAELVHNGEADFATSFNITNRWAHEGEVAYEQPMENLRGLVGGINDYYIGIVARDEFLEKHGIESLHDIREKEIPVRVITNPDGTLAEYSTRLTLEAYGLDYEMIEDFGGSVELTSNDVIKSKFQDGTADLHILAMSKAHPVITEIAVQTDITVLGIDEDAMKELEKYGYQEDVFPAGQFEGQDEEVTTGGFKATYIATEDMDDDLAYTIAKTVYENKEALVQAHSSVADFDPEQAANPDYLGVPLHPGAEKFYKEVGLIE